MGKKFKKLKWRRKLSLADQVEYAKGEANDALNMFAQANEKLEGVNALLNSSVEDARIQLAQLEKHIDRAETEINMNKAVQTRLADFVIPQQV